METDDTHVLMTKAEFDTLADYSCSLPTGTTIGKRWKRSDAFDRRRNPTAPLQWVMGEYTRQLEPGVIEIRWRHILVVD